MDCLQVCTVRALNQARHQEQLETSASHLIEVDVVKLTLRLKMYAPALRVFPQDKKNDDDLPQHVVLKKKKN